MSQVTLTKLFSLSTLGAATLMLMNQSAFAHTRLETSTSVEGVRVHNYLNISHGCSDPTGAKAGEGALKNQPTFGTSLVFPNASTYTPVIGIDSTSDNGANKVINYTDKPASDFYSPATGIAAVINKGGPFPYTGYHVDSNKAKDGFWSGGKAYDQTISTYVQVDFYTNAVTINSKSCARSVTFALAVADICNPSAKSPNIGDSDALFWSPIPTNSKTATSSITWNGVPGGPYGAPVADEARGIIQGQIYSNYDGWANGNQVGMGAAGAIPGDGFNSPATYKVTRDLTKNPLPAGCTGNGGKGDDVYVYPSAKQINEELPVWTQPNGSGDKLWY